MAGKGLYANIHGLKEDEAAEMRKKGAKGAPTAAGGFVESKTVYTARN